MGQAGFVWAQVAGPHAAANTSVPLLVISRHCHRSSEVTHDFELGGYEYAHRGKDLGGKTVKMDVHLNTYLG